MTYIQRSTLASALYEYVKEREESERRHGYSGDSIHLASIRQFLYALRNGEPVEIRGDM